uniref:Uncharacterized protein n=1 Tax=Trichogramma kaykai TaxID=54128 RepID=A0ABD2W789_9HYME
MRPTDEFSDYKAVEHRFFLLYCGPFVLKDFLTDKAYNHFMLLHAACRMLSSPNVMTFATIAKSYLELYVEQAPDVYKPEFVNLNVHYLNHLVDDLMYAKSNLENISAFPFETELGKIKNFLLSPHRILAQYCRRLHEEREIINKVAQLPKDLEIKKVKKVMNNKIVQILEFVQIDDEVCLSVVDYSRKRSVYEFPCESSMLNTYEIIDQVTDSTKRPIKLDDIQFKLVKLMIGCEKSEQKTFVLPLLH